MHRSGTSLISSVLQKAGLFIGDELIGAGEGNTRGHFENIDFNTFQIEAFKFLSIDSDGWDLQSVETLNEEFDKEAAAIIRKNEREEWGWKDPRTTLFLKYWKNKIPEIKYLFLYRDPWDVADSLYRRVSDKKIMVDPTIPFKSWNFYNQEIISMYKEHMEDSILIHTDDVVKDIPGIIEKINNRLGFHLKSDSAKDIFDKSMYKSSDENLFYSYQTALAFPEVIITLNELKALSGKESFQIEKLSKDKISEKAISNFFQGWEDRYVYKQKANNLEKELKWMKETKFWKLRELWQRVKGKKV